MAVLPQVRLDNIASDEVRRSRDELVRAHTDPSVVHPRARTQVEPTAAGPNDLREPARIAILMELDFGNDTRDDLFVRRHDVPVAANDAEREATQFRAVTITAASRGFVTLIGTGSHATRTTEQ